MQIITVLSATAAMAATASAGTAGLLKTSELMANFQSTQPFAKVVNRCNYDVYLWSVLKAMGCSSDNMVKLKQGEVYHENLQSPQNGIGVSIKISKTQACKGVDITQLEYFLQEGGDYSQNYLDVSYVDCGGKDCPTMKDGYYLKAGTQSGKLSAKGMATTSSANNKICPVISCTDEASCSKQSYVNPDDEQTRSCGLDQNLELYLCGGNAPSDNDSKPASSSQKVETPSAKPTPSKASSAPAENIKVNVAAVTPAAEIKEPIHTPKVKTNVVYVTKYEYVNAKRSEHVHHHARRHQNFHA